MKTSYLKIISWNWPVPRNAYEVRIFHGLARFYRKFIKKFNHIYAPLIDTFRGSKQPLQWTEAVDRNFKLLKKKITEKPILALPSFDKVFQVPPYLFQLVCIDGYNVLHLVADLTLSLVSFRCIFKLPWVPLFPLISMN